MLIFIKLLRQHCLTLQTKITQNKCRIIQKVS